MTYKSIVLYLPDYLHYEYLLIVGLYHILAFNPAYHLEKNV